MPTCNTFFTELSDRGGMYSVMLQVTLCLDDFEGKSRSLDKLIKSHLGIFPMCMYLLTCWTKVLQSYFKRAKNNIT